MMKLYPNCFWILMLNVSLPQKIIVQFSDIFLHPGLGGLAGKVEDRLKNKNTWNDCIVYELLLNLILHSRKLTHPTKWESWKVIDSKVPCLGMGMLVSCR